jgi:hypothetical protein
MPAYLVLKPCAYVNADGAAVSHTAATPVVAEIPDGVAKELGDAVQLLDSNPVDKVKPTPFPDDATVDLRAGKRDPRAKPAPDVALGETDG